MFNMRIQWQWCIQSNKGTFFFFFFWVKYVYKGTCTHICERFSNIKKKKSQLSIYVLDLLSFLFNRKCEDHVFNQIFFVILSRQCCAYNIWRGNVNNKVLCVFPTFAWYGNIIIACIIVSYAYEIVIIWILIFESCKS